MKTLRITIAAAILALVSCKNEPAVATSATHIQANDTIAKTPPQKLAADLDGLWISDAYLASIEKTRSIYKSKEYGTVNRLYGFTLYKDSLATGKTELLGFSEHEGGIVYPMLYNASNNRFDYDQDRARELDGPMDLSLYPIKDNLVEIAYTKPKSQKDRFRKIGDSKSDIYLLDETLNTMLFEGNYTDSISGKDVQFRRDGKVQGIPGYDHYSMLYDFGEGLEFDTIFLWQGESNGDRITYHFKIDGKTIRLYATGLNEKELAYTISKKPSFTFIRK